MFGSRAASVTEKGYYVGSISSSLERLPRWYQLMAFSGVVIAMYHRNSFVIQWLVVYLHNSLGTEIVWYPEYKLMLDDMSFNERIGFTTYAATLALSIMFLYRVCCRQTLQMSWSGGHIFANRKTPTVIVCVIMCTVEALLLRMNIARILSEEDSPAHRALYHRPHSPLSSSHTSPSRVAMVAYRTYFDELRHNPHFIIQAEILRVFVLSFLRYHIPLAVCSLVYRVARDVPRQIHAALRWYLATESVMSLVYEIVRLVLTLNWTGGSERWWRIVWSLSYLGVVNYVHGPTTRAGLLKTMSSRQALQQAVRYTITTCGIWGMARLFVLTLVVGVHVVELVCIWVAMFMWIVWTPAIVDACATDYMAVLSMMTCYLVHQMELMTAVGAARMCGMMMLWWLDGCLVYNVVVNVSRSRYVGLVVVTCVLLWVMAPGMVPSATSLPTMIVHNNSYNNNNSSSSSSSSSSSTYRVYPTDVYPNSSHLDACPSDAAAGEHRGGNASERSCPPMYNGDEGAAKGAGEAGGSDAAARSADKAMAEEDVLLSSPSRLASTLARVQRSFATSLAEGRGNVDEMGIVDGVVQRYLVFLAQIAEYKALPSPTVFSACCNDDGKEAYKVIITAGLLLATSLVGMNMAIGYQQTAEVKARMRRSGIVLVNYSVMLRKIVRTVVNLICIASFLLTWWLCEVFVLPRAASWLPLPAVIAKGFSVVAACVVIGGVTDMNESIYDLLMRLFGVLNPPSRKNVLMSTDDSADEDEPRRDSDVASFTK